MDHHYLTTQFGNGLKQRGQAEENRWAHEQNQNAMRKLREQMQDKQKDQTNNRPKPGTTPGTI